MDAPPAPSAAPQSAPPPARRTWLALLLSVLAIVSFPFSLYLFMLPTLALGGLALWLARLELAGAPRHAANERGRGLAQLAIGISCLGLAVAVLFLAVLADEYLFHLFR
jgi:hypothetical protein